MMATVLVVDDEADFAWVVGTLLEDEGYEVRTAQNGRLALHLLQSEPVQLVLCDIHMPVLDGIGLRKEVEKAGLGSIPFVFMSSIDAQAAERLVGPAHVFVQKPFSVETLTGVVRQGVSPA